MWVSINHMIGSQEQKISGSGGRGRGGQLSIGNLRRSVFMWGLLCFYQTPNSGEISKMEKVTMLLLELRFKNQGRDCGFKGVH